ncbi:hypothetical protein P8452_32789 [Trifolium repens]|nr:hypothetical protein P8452_32789 [Trifolium repens]
MTVVVGVDGSGGRIVEEAGDSATESVIGSSGASSSPRIQVKVVEVNVRNNISAIIEAIVSRICHTFTVLDSRVFSEPW